MANKKRQNIVKEEKSFLSGGIGILIAIFFAVSACYFSWMYAVPFFLNMRVSQESVNKFFQQKFNYTTDYYSANVYTTPSLGLGLRFVDFNLIYPNANASTDEGVFLKSKSAIFEVAAIPLLLKTIKFNQVLFRGVSINTFQNAQGQYAYQEHIKSNFNPNMKKYVLEVPEIKLLSYSFINYNQQTDTFKKDFGNSYTIRPMDTKNLLSQSIQVQEKAITLK